jgi:hypothetical protein
MTKTALPAFVAMSALWLSGCGTICNLASKNPQVYGGIQGDIECVKHLDHLGPSSASGKSVLFLFLLLPAEGSLTLAGDTLTLPLVVCLRQNPSRPDEPVSYIVVDHLNSVDANNPPPANVILHQPRPFTFDEFISEVLEIEGDRQLPALWGPIPLNPIPQGPTPWNPALPDPEGSLPLPDVVVDDLAQPP